MIDLFLAGMETTSSSLMWTFLYMIHHPDIQKRVHQELDEVTIIFFDISVIVYPLSTMTL